MIRENDEVMEAVEQACHYCTCVASEANPIYEIDGEWMCRLCLEAIGGN